MTTTELSTEQIFRKFVQLRAVGRKMERLGWPSSEDALGRLRRFVAGTARAPSMNTLRAAFTYANETGEFQLVVDAAKLLGIERLFEDAYLCGQVMRAREPLGLLELDKWEAVLAAGT
jgi:hypothetical protein